MRTTSFSTVKPLRVFSPGLRRILIKLNFVTAAAADALAARPPEVKLITAVADFAPGSEDRIVEQLSRELNIEVADLTSKAAVDAIARSGLLGLIEGEVLLSHRCVPVSSREDELSVAFADPLDLESISNIEFLAGKRRR